MIGDLSTFGTIFKHVYVLHVYKVYFQQNQKIQKNNWVL